MLKGKNILEAEPEPKRLLWNEHHDQNALEELGLRRKVTWMTL